MLPDSLAGRTCWLLIGGFLTTALLTFIASDWGQTSLRLQRIAATATVIDRAPAELRPRLVATLHESGLSYAWSDAVAPPTLTHDFMAHHLARDIRVALAGTALQHVEAGYESTARAGATLGPPASAHVWMQLSDGTWLHIELDTDRIGALWTVRIVGALAVLLLGLSTLAFWAAHKVVEPLRRFAHAAHRLGTDVTAPAMKDVGPSEIREAVGAFNQMQSRIRRFVEDRTLMLAAISHDLRTTLTRMKLRSEFIGDAHQRNKALADLEEMDQMLSATVSYARDQMSTEAATRVDLAVLLQSLCDDQIDAGRPVTYHGPAHIHYFGHPIALRRIFTNLIDNAIKYGREANVTARVAPGGLEVVISDRGPGIPLGLREQVFAPFFRGEPSRSRETGGTGLGLTVARSLVRHHGGQINLSERPGGGLSVQVVLPTTEPIDAPSGRNSRNNVRRPLRAVVRHLTDGTR